MPSELRRGLVPALALLVAAAGPGPCRSTPGCEELDLSRPAAARPRDPAGFDAHPLAGVPGVNLLVRRTGFFGRQVEVMLARARGEPSAPQVLEDGSPALIAFGAGTWTVTARGILPGSGAPLVSVCPPAVGTPATDLLGGRLGAGGLDPFTQGTLVPLDAPGGPLAVAPRGPSEGLSPGSWWCGDDEDLARLPDRIRFGGGRYTLALVAVPATEPGGPEGFEGWVVADPESRGVTVLRMGPRGAKGLLFAGNRLFLAGPARDDAPSLWILGRDGVRADPALPLWAEWTRALDRVLGPARPGEGLVPVDGACAATVDAPGVEEVLLEFRAGAGRLATRLGSGRILWMEPRDP